MDPCQGRGGSGAVRGGPVQHVCGSAAATDRSSSGSLEFRNPLSFRAASTVTAREIASVQLPLQNFPEDFLRAKASRQNLARAISRGRRVVASCRSARMEAAAAHPPGGLEGIGGFGLASRRNASASPLFRLAPPELLHGHLPP